ncbi:MAG: tail fiber protein [Candidatus Sphingomonas phytovorans]|nr:tail fiber protein [Sphingomonas sp.]WEK01335.1 MAG: tail fiber protein [Sphingomonas sp.]
MSDSWLSEIRIFPYGKIPTGWHLCDGTIMQVTANQALFALLGNRYGGDGRVTFGLPDMRGRVPIHLNPADPTCNQVGMAGGAEGVTLTVNQIPAHSHLVSAFSANGTIPIPVNGYPSAVAPNGTAGTPSPPQIYGPIPTGTGTTTLFNTGSVLAEGGGQAHENRQPTMAMNWCICVSGFFPSRN